MAARPPFRSVVTGGPGAGKSTLLNAAAAAGMAVSPEVAREILQAPGGMELREHNPVGFAQAMLAHELAAFEDSLRQGVTVLFDRGFPDIAGFLDLEGLPIPRELERICRDLRYEGPIFRAPPWREIYAQDAERIQDWEEAVASDAAISSAWRRFGYQSIDLPFAPVEDRLRFVCGVLDNRA
ncbi:AAA family ATPase [Altererythrobacter fulvus]|uniref:AAA family ATPase n=1 Tax=Caenibius fulvus TaxID=2126012 RepID=UPI003018A7A5